MGSFLLFRFCSVPFCAPTPHFEIHAPYKDSMDARLLELMMDLMEITLDCTKLSPHEKATLLTKKKRPEILQKIFDLGDKITQFRATMDGELEAEKAEQAEKKRGRPKGTRPAEPAPTTTN